MMKKSKLVGTLVGAICLLAATATSAPAGSDEDGHHDHLHDEEFVSMPEIDPVEPDQRGEPMGRGTGVALPPSLEGCELHQIVLDGGRGARGAAGLTNASDDGAKRETSRLGFAVTASEAAHIDAGIEARSKIDIEVVREALSDQDLLDLRWDPERHVLDAYVLVARPSSSAPNRTGLDGIRIVEVVSSLDGEALTTLQDALMEQVEDGDVQGAVASSLDITCGKIMVETYNDVDFEAVDRIAAALDEKRASITVVQVGADLAPQLMSRWDHHHNDQDGGLGMITSPGNNPACTTAMPWGADGGWGVTAAHCMPGEGYDTNPTLICGNWEWIQGNVILNPLNSNGCTIYQFGEDLDVAVVKKYSWEDGRTEHMIHGGNHNMVGMNWWQWDRDLAAIGDPFCHSGFNWAGTPCGGLLQKDYAICLPASWLAPAVCLNDQFRADALSEPGDSGGSFWSEATGRWYSGVLSGGSAAGWTWFSHSENMRALWPGNVAPEGMF